MKSYCLKCRKDTESVNSRVSNTGNGKTVTLSNCAVCGRSWKKALESFIDE